MGALTQRQEAVTSSNDELKKRILHHTLCFITFYMICETDMQLCFKGVLKHLVGKSTEENEITTEENQVDNQLSGNDVPSSDLSRRVDSTEKIKRRSLGLGVTYLFQLSKLYAKAKDVDALRSEIEALNKSLQKQEEEKLQMRQELDEIKEQVQTLMEHT
ncbi:hypothetical protein VNO80_15697 [Phaseolus coccineus]|uniref:Uncharacterized protein n=1 Tax=Phaseolus coccineus TaxID=3886 RepID=A0AAN9MM38_PHACN